MESQVKKKPTRGHWPNKFKLKNFLDTVYPDGKPVDVYRHWEMCCGSKIFYVVTVDDEGEEMYQLGSDLRQRLLEDHLDAVIEVCTREHLI